MDSKFSVDVVLVTFLVVIGMGQYPNGSYKFRVSAAIGYCVLLESLL